MLSDFQNLLLLFFFFFFFLCVCVCVCVCVCPHPWHMEVPRLGVESELQLPAYATATAMPDPNHICNLNSNSQQCWILNLLSKARDQAHVLMDTSRIRYLWATRGMSIHSFHPFVFSWPLYSWNWHTHTHTNISMTKKYIFKIYLSFNTRLKPSYSFWMSISLNPTHTSEFWA